MSKRLVKLLLQDFMAIRFFIPFNTLFLSEYSLKIAYKKNKTSITMDTYEAKTVTEELSATIPVLKHFLPNIFTSECFNDLNLSFEEEVAHTEIGHLFEHILLEYLCAIKLSYGYPKAEFSGVTRWNWNYHPRGVFNIEINANQDDRFIFNLALKKAISLMDTIFKESADAEKNTVLNVSQSPYAFVELL